MVGLKATHDAQAAAFVCNDRRLAQRFSGRGGPGAERDRAIAIVFFTDPRWLAEKHIQGGQRSSGCRRPRAEGVAGCAATIWRSRPGRRRHAVLTGTREFFRICSMEGQVWSPKARRRLPACQATPCSPSMDEDYNAQGGSRNALEEAGATGKGRLRARSRDNSAKTAAPQGSVASENKVVLA